MNIDERAAPNTDNDHKKHAIYLNVHTEENT